VPDTDYTDLEGVTEEGLAEGGAFFRTNCTKCHNSVGAGGALPDGRYAPSLFEVSAKHMYEAMLTGPQQMPVFTTWVVGLGALIVACVGIGARGVRGNEQPATAASTEAAEVGVRNDTRRVGGSSPAGALS